MNKTLKITTLGVLSAAAFALLNWENWTLADGIPGNTISAVSRKLGREQPGIPLFCGALCRHLWGDDARTLAAFFAGWAMGEHWPCLDKEDES